jgi:Fe-S-cluster containining protein
VTATIDAGEFGAWIDAMQQSLRGERDADVPCGSCTACCRSSQFVHIGPDEADTLSHIAAELLVPAPGLPTGHVLLGYDEHGCCPMLVDDRCSIYEHRPRTCRTYDCRVFTAAGLQPGEPQKQAIAERVRRWRFRFASDASRRRQGAVVAAAADITAHPDRYPDGAARSATGVAVVAVEVHERFVR